MVDQIAVVLTLPVRPIHVRVAMFAQLCICHIFGLDLTRKCALIQTIILAILSNHVVWLAALRDAHCVLNQRVVARAGRNARGQVRSRFARGDAREITLRRGKLIERAADDVPNTTHQHAARRHADVIRLRLVLLELAGGNAHICCCIEVRKLCAVG